MIGIVLVSHSEKITDGIKEMIQEMTGPGVLIHSAGGTDDGRLGTSAVKIMDSIHLCRECKRILLFADIGSAILSTEAALDLIDEELKEKCVFVDGPIVEGSFVAAVQSIVSDNLDDILREVEQMKTSSKMS